MSSPLISFIVPLYNQLSKTQEMLASLRESISLDISYEIILCDDYSTDGTRDWLLNLNNPDIRVHLNQQNQGYAYTNNVGARSAQGFYLGFLNNDLLLKPGWLEPMLEAFSSPVKKLGLVGNLQYRIDNDALDHAGMDLNLAGQFVHIHDCQQ